MENLIKEFDLKDADINCCCTCAFQNIAKAGIICSNHNIYVQPHWICKGYKDGKEFVLHVGDLV